MRRNLHLNKQILLVGILFAFSQFTLGQNCDLSGLGSVELYTKKTTEPIDAFFPKIEDGNFIYKTENIENSPIASESLKRVLLVANRNQFIIFDKDDRFCSAGSVFTDHQDKAYNFIALKKDGTIMRKFVPMSYRWKIQDNSSRSFSAYANADQRGSSSGSRPELVNKEELVVAVSINFNYADDNEVFVFATPDEIKRSYHSTLVEALKSTGMPAEPVDQRNVEEELVSDVETETSIAEPLESNIAEEVDSPSPVSEEVQEVEMESPQEEVAESTEMIVDEEPVPNETLPIAEVEQNEEASGSEANSAIIEEEAPQEETTTIIESEPSDEALNSSEITEETPVAAEEPIVEEEEVDNDLPKVSESMQEEVSGSSDISNDVEEEMSDPVKFTPPPAVNLGTRKIPEDREELTEEDKSEISDKAIYLIEQLESAFKQLVDRNVSSFLKEQVRMNTVENLFLDEEREVTVSSVNRDEYDYYLIGDYLKRLENLRSYDKIELDISEIHKVSNLVKQSDGTYRGTVTFTQVFKGFMNAGDVTPTYGDITHKNVEIIVRRQEVFSGGSRPEVEWIVLLGDIGVSQTRRL